MTTLHIVTHTHWDREWYLTFQQFRLKLVHLVDKLLDILESDPLFHSFMLDGQTIVLDDYLALRPEREADLRRLVQAGRITIGPWHILPDEFLVSPEATIRNLLQGRRSAGSFGPVMKTGYIPDTFGHIGQMPQILKGFGIETAAVQRGLADEPAEFWWQAPDGSRVFMAYLRDGYGNAAELSDRAPEKFAELASQLRDALAPHSAAPHMLLMWGTDHSEPAPNTSQVIAGAQAHLPADRLIHSSLAEYLAAARASLKGIEIPLIQGELRACRRHPLLPNVLSTRMWIKQRNHACETLLEKWAEPFSTLAEQACPASRPPAAVAGSAAILRQAWRMLMENHPHDSICGCSIDQVAVEMGPRFDQVEQLGEALTAQSLETLARAVDTRQADRAAAIVVFNPVAGPRRDSVQVDLELPPGSGEIELVDENGQPLPHRQVGLGSQELINIRLGQAEFRRMSGLVSDGRISNFGVCGFTARRTGPEVQLEIALSERGEPDLAVWQSAMEQVKAFLEDDTITSYAVRGRSLAATRLVFLAGAVPGHGWRTVWVKTRPARPAQSMQVNRLAAVFLPLALKAARSPLVKRLAAGRPGGGIPIRRPHLHIENEYYRVELEPGGTLSLSERIGGQKFSGLNRFVDGGDRGDEYNYAPPPADQLVTPHFKQARVERSALDQTLHLALEMPVPEALADDRKSRSRRTTLLTIHTRITLTRGVERVDFHSEVENMARDHRLRVHFPAPFAVDEAWHDGHFEVVRRPGGQPSFDSSWIEQPHAEVPQRAFSAIQSKKGGLMLAERGLPEVEICKGPNSQAEIALTLLRCVGWLSRDDFGSRATHAGPALETPAAQMPGRWAFDYAVIPFAPAGFVSACQQAYAFNAPLRAVTAACHPGALAPKAAFIQAEPAQFILSAIKTAEDGQGLLVRGYNLGGDEVSVTLSSWRPFLKAWQTNLAEEPQAALQPDADGKVRLTVNGHQVVSVLFK